VRPRAKGGKTRDRRTVHPKAQSGLPPPMLYLLKATHKPLEANVAPLLCGLRRLPNHKEGSLGEGKNAAEKILRYMRRLNLDLRSETSCTICGDLTLT
jgi:hypothetical protein